MTEVNEKELYEQYGKAMINLEIAQQRVNMLKEQIAKIINTPRPKVVVKNSKIENSPIVVNSPGAKTMHSTKIKPVNQTGKAEVKKE